MKLQVLPPRRNLGCLGFIIGSLYFDFYRIPHLGMFSRFKGRKLWLHLKGFKYEGALTKVIFRLTTRKHFIYRRYSPFGWRIS